MAPGVNVAWNTDKYQPKEYPHEKVQHKWGKVSGKKSFQVDGLQTINNEKVKHITTQPINSQKFVNRKVCPFKFGTEAETIMLGGFQIS